MPLTPKHDLILQARLGSTRLPQKILRPFWQDDTILDVLLRRLKTAQNVHSIIVATTTNTEDDAIEARCAQHGVACFRGEPDDVLQRFLDAMAFFRIETTIRICADNPFIDIDLLDQLIASVATEVDYASFKVDDTPAIRTHLGIFTEFITADALRRAIRLGATPFDREHVTKFVYEHPDDFRLQWLNPPDWLNKWRTVRLTVDTHQDFETAQQIYEWMMRHADGIVSLPSLEIALDALPHIQTKMRQEIEANTK